MVGKEAKKTGEPGPWTGPSESLSINEALAQTVDEIKAGQIDDYDAAIARIRELADYEGGWNSRHIDDCVNGALDLLVESSD